MPCLCVLVGLSQQGFHMMLHVLLLAASQAQAPEWVDLVRVAMELTWTRLIRFSVALYILAPTAVNSAAIQHETPMALCMAISCAILTLICLSHVRPTPRSALHESSATVPACPVFETLDVQAHPHWSPSYLQCLVHANDGATVAACQ